MIRRSMLRTTCMHSARSGGVNTCAETEGSGSRTPDRCPHKLRSAPHHRLMGGGGGEAQLLHVVAHLGRHGKVAMRFMQLHVEWRSSVPVCQNQT
eukprot:COSAG01_NODE_23561_length_810_cov_5.341772_2_plen_95_part_00